MRHNKNNFLSKKEIKKEENRDIWTSRRINFGLHADYNQNSAWKPSLSFAFLLP